MRNFSMDEMKRLTNVEDDLCISIYMPVDPKATDTDAQRIRFKNMIRRSEKAAAESGEKQKALADRIDEARRLVENDYFWRYQRNGLAAFIAPEGFFHYRLPITFEEQFKAGERFHLKPLLSLFMADGRFYLLALSQNQVRLFSCTRFNAEAVDLPDDVPKSLADALGYDTKDYQLQFHTGSADIAGDRRAMYHGQGVSIDDNKDEILRYFQAVDRGISKVMNENNAPLVLAGVEYLLPIFREATAYSSVMDNFVTGNPDNQSPEALHEKAWEIARPAFEKSREEEMERYRRMAGKGYTAAGVRGVVPAAAYGRVETLFVALDQARPGRFDRENNEITVYEDGAEEGEDLLDRAAVETIRHGGTVYAVNVDEMPDPHAPTAAILRF